MPCRVCGGVSETGGAVCSHCIAEAARAVEEIDADELERFAAERRVNGRVVRGV